MNAFLNATLHGSELSPSVADYFCHGGKSNQVNGLTGCAGSRGNLNKGLEEKRVQ